MSNKYNAQQENIIKTAEGLLAEKGYANISVNEVIKSSGIAKGTFYHYFASKESLFDGIITRLSDQALRPINKIIDRKDLSAIEKFNSMVEYGKRYKLARKKVYRAISRWIFSDENIRLRHKLFKYYSRFLVPAFTRVIEQGTKEKSFQVSNPRIAADMVINLLISAGEAMWPYLAKEKISSESKLVLSETFTAYNEAIERMLGVKTGKLKILDIKMLDEFIKD